MSHHDTRRAGDGAGTLDADSAAGTQGQDPPSSMRPVLIWIFAIVLVLVGAAALLRVAFAERIAELTEARLEEAERFWQQNGPASYDLDLEIRGARPGSARVEVRDGIVTAATRDGRQPPRWTWDEWSVPGQFDTLQRELELAEDPQHEMHAAVGTQLRLRCDFDPEFGFPQRYHRYASGGAPEVFWRVTRFEPFLGEGE